MNKYQYQKNTISGFTKGDDMFFSTKLILREAEKYGVDWEIISGTKIIRLTLDKKTKFFHFQIPSATTTTGIYSCQNKETTRNLLINNDLSIAKGFVISDKDSRKEKKAVFDNLQKPLVIKPNEGTTHGDDVFVGIDTKNDFDKTLNKILKKGTGSVLVEEMFVGDEYRILATRNRVIGVINRMPANVIGDGVSTIQKLIDKKNQDKRRSDDYSTALLKIKTDDLVKNYLVKQDFSLDSVPVKDKQIFLRKTSNLSTGGDSFDVTDLVDESVKKIAVDVIRTIPGLAMGGIDFMTKDIKKKQSKGSYVIIEINHSPMLSMHDLPYQGKSRHAAREFLFLMFPELRSQKL